MDSLIFACLFPFLLALSFYPEHCHSFLLHITITIQTMITCVASSPKVPLASQHIHRIWRWQRATTEHWVMLFFHKCTWILNSLELGRCFTKYLHEATPSIQFSVLSSYRSLLMQYPVYVFRYEVHPIHWCLFNIEIHSVHLFQSRSFTITILYGISV